MPINEKKNTHTANALKSEQSQNLKYFPFILFFLHFFSLQRNEKKAIASFQPHDQY